MTDVTGSMFISYRRSPARHSGDAEALLVRDALRDRGVPTWRDLDDLNSVPTEDDLISTLSRENIAGAVMLISPEIEKSQMVRKVEAPAILDRFRKLDGFILKPVLINLEYTDVDRVMGRPGAFQKISHFDIDRISKPSLDAEDARRIAKAVLKQRLLAVHHHDSGQACSVGMYSRRSPSAKGFTLCHDVTPYFTGRESAPGAYSKIETALYDAATALASTGFATTGDKIPIIARGNAALPLGVLFGAVYSSFVFYLEWKQAAPGAPDETWSLKSGISDIPTTVYDIKDNLESEDLILAISINADVERATTEYLEAENLSPRAMISVGLENGPLQQGETISPQQGLKIAYEAINTARNLKTQLRMTRANLHLFLACPLSLAVLIGQNLNTFGECVVYEHFGDRTPAYAPAHRFRPSNFTYQPC